MKKKSRALQAGAAIALAFGVTLPSGKAAAYCWDAKASGVYNNYNGTVADTGDRFYTDPTGAIPNVGWECSSARRAELMSAYGIDSGEWGDYGYNSGVCDYATPLARTIDALELLEVTRGSSPELQSMRDLARDQYSGANLNADCDNDTAYATTFCYVIGANQTDLHLPFFYDEDVTQRAGTIVHEAAHKEAGTTVFSCGRSHDGDCGPDNECDEAYDHGGAYSWSADFHKSFCQKAVNTTTALRYRSLSRYNRYLNTKFETNTAPELTSCSASTSPHLRDKLHAFWPMKSSGTQVDEVGGRNFVQAAAQVSTAIDGVTGPIGAHNSNHMAQKFAFQSTDGLKTASGFDLSGPFTVSAWARFDPGFWNLNEPGVIVAKWNEANGGRSFQLRYVVDYSTGYSAMRIVVSTNGNDALQGDVPFTPTQNKWNQFVLQWVDTGTATDGKSAVLLTINDGPATQFTVLSDKIFNSTTAPLTVAHRAGTAAGTQLDPWVGSVDSIGVWKRSISAAERNELYNGGTGREFAKLTAEAHNYQFTSLGWWQF